MESTNKIIKNNQINVRMNYVNLVPLYETYQLRHMLPSFIGEREDV